MKGIIAIIFIIIALVLFFKFTQPMMAEMNALKFEVSELDSASNKANKLKERQSELEEKYNSISEMDRDRLIKLLPDGVDNVLLLIEIDSIAKELGVRISNPQLEDFNVGGQVKSSEDGGDKYGSVGLSFTVRMPYEDFLQFLSKLENNLRLVDIVSINMLANQDPKSNADSYNIKLKTYWLK